MNNSLRLLKHQEMFTDAGECMQSLRRLQLFLQQNNLGHVLLVKHNQKITIFICDALIICLFEHN